MQQYTSAIIFNLDHTRILLLKRANHKKTHPGYITGFGGHVEVGETPEQGIVRELDEETGISASDLKTVAICHFDDADGYENREIFVFQCTALSLDITADPHDGTAIIIPFDFESIDQIRSQCTEACWFSMQHLLTKNTDVLDITSQMRDEEILRKLNKKSHLLRGGELM